MNKKIFQATREQYGNNVVTYKGLELVAINKLDRGAVLNFSWGDTGAGSEALSYSMLKEVSSIEVASQFSKIYMRNVISKIMKDEWTLEGLEVVQWINTNTDFSIDESAFENVYEEQRREERRKEERRVKREQDFQEEAQKKLKVYNERKREDRRKEDRRVQREEDFKVEAQRKLKVHEQYKEEINNYKLLLQKKDSDIQAYKSELTKYKDFVESLDIKAIYEKYTKLS